MTDKRITLIGAGRMGSALAGGWLKAGWAGRIDIVDPNPRETVQGWASRGVVTLNSAPHAADLLVVAVKPQVFGELADGIAARIDPQTQVLSIMAGVSMATLRQRLTTPNIARAMPNTPGLVGQGVSILCLPDESAPGTEAEMRALLDPLGAVEGPIGEDLLPAATAVSGCGPAYGFLLAEVMASAGVAHGLAPDMAMRLARKTVEGAGALMAASEEDAATLRRNVTSPNGVTQAALEVLMADSAMPALFRDAVAAAIARDLELTAETG
ncbi:MAG: pyrroline-5-carboxylate reductase [Alphaproteobacteria bacterium]|nr:pyrroline-5-carboxylate reductase [Alphaproteobacteria bacterium]